MFCHQKVFQSGLSQYRIAYVSYLVKLAIIKYTNALIVDSCGSPGVPINGQTFGNLTTVGSIVNHTCNEGYVINGASQRECLPDGSWSAPLPLCDRMCN